MLCAHVAELVVLPGANLLCSSSTPGFPRLDDDGPSRPPPISKRVGDYMAKLGAVPVSARNMLRLFKAGEAVLLYPGGAKEALHQKVSTVCFRRSRGQRDQGVRYTRGSAVTKSCAK